MRDTKPPEHSTFQTVFASPPIHSLQKWRSWKPYQFLRGFYLNLKKKKSAPCPPVKVSKQEVWSVLEKGSCPVSQVACTSGKELRLPRSRTIEGIEGSLVTCWILGLEHVLNPTLLSLGKKPCRTPATTISGRSAGRDSNNEVMYLLEFWLTAFILNNTLNVNYRNLIFIKRCIRRACSNVHSYFIDLAFGESVQSNSTHVWWEFMRHVLTT